MDDTRKQLECLYAWADFYRANQQWSSLDKAQDQIEEFKKENQL